MRVFIFIKFSFSYLGCLNETDYNLRRQSFLHVHGRDTSGNVSAWNSGNFQLKRVDSNNRRGFYRNRNETQNAKNIRKQCGRSYSLLFVACEMTTLNERFINCYFTQREWTFISVQLFLNILIKKKSNHSKFVLNIK